MEIGDRRFEVARVRDGSWVLFDWEKNPWGQWSLGDIWCAGHVPARLQPAGAGAGEGGPPAPDHRGEVGGREVRDA